jgi:hypothetical protein
LKKLIIGIVLGLSALTAAAQYSAIANYDYENADGRAAINSTHFGQAGIRFNTDLGSFDVLGNLKQTVTGDRTHTGGAEVAFNKPIRMGDVTVVGTAAFGAMDSQKYYRLGAEGFVKLVPSLDAYGGYRFTNNVGSDRGAATNRYVVGLKAVAAQNMDVKLGLTQTRYSNEKYHGITSGVEVKF